MVTCKKHYCEQHRTEKCPCPCKVCSAELHQAAEDNRLLKEMQEADYPALCDEHDWPPDLHGDAKCGACGLPYAEWTDFDIDTDNEKDD